MSLIRNFQDTVGRAIISPPQYVFWSGVCAVSAMMARLIWTHTYVRSEHDHVFGNLFVLLIGPPGIGKTNAIGEARTLVRDVGVRVGPDDVTGERLVDLLRPPPPPKKKPKKGEKPHKPPPDIAWGSMSLFLDEADTLFHGGQARAAKTYLNHLYDCREDPFNRETYQHQHQGVKELCMTLLAGSTPAHLHEHFAPLEWQQGLPSRFIYVYGEKPNFRTDFGRGDMVSLLKNAEEVTRFIGMTTAVGWRPEAMEAYVEWCRANWHPKPIHNLLRGYSERRALTIAKLAFVMAVSDCRENISLDDYHWAQAALADAEQDLPRVLALSGGNETRDVEEFLERWLAVRKTAEEWEVRRLLGVRINHYMVEGVISELVNQRRLVQTGPKTAPNRTFKGGLWENPA